MTDLPIAVPSSVSPQGKRAQVNASQQNTGAPGAAQPDATSFSDALAQVRASGRDKAVPAEADTTVASKKTGSSKKTAADTAPALDASALPTGLTLPLLTPLTPALARQTGLGTAVAGTKADSSKKTALDTAPALDASALPTGLAATPLMPKTAAANALSTDHSEPLKFALSTAVLEPANPRTEPPAAFSTAAQAISNDSAIAPPSVPAPSGTVEARVGQRGWDQGVGEKLVWMADQKHQVAQLHLNPPELGPLKITLSLDQNQASAQFFSAHASVREAIEAALPRLREMLADSGIALGNTSVGAEAFREPTQQQPREHVAQSAPTGAVLGTLSSGERQLRPMHGLVDTFA